MNTHVYRECFVQWSHFKCCVHCGEWHHITTDLYWIYGSQLKPLMALIPKLYNCPVEQVTPEAAQLLEDKCCLCAEHYTHWQTHLKDCIGRILQQLQWRTVHENRPFEYWITWMIAVCNKQPEVTGHHTQLYSLPTHMTSLCTVQLSKHLPPPAEVTTHPGIAVHM